MSKTNKNKKNITSNTTPAAKPWTSTLTIILAVAVIALTGLGIWTAVKKFGPEVAPVVPTDENPAGNDVKDMAKYLKEKYDKDFTYSDTTMGASLFYADEFHGMVAVTRREIVTELNSKYASLYTDKYADNGYMIANADKAADYYRPFISVDLGNSRLLPFIDIVADPSSVTPDTDYPTYLKVIRNISVPQIIILTDKTLSQDELQQLEDDMIKMGSPITVRVFTMDAEDQKNAIPTSILIQGASPNIQYLKTLNADGIFDN